MRSRKVLIVAAVILVVAAFVAWRALKPAAAPKFTTVRVDRGDVVAKVTASGTLSALVTVQVGSQVSGRIQELHADFNDHVKKGQVIARLDPELFQAAVAQARANRAAAVANLEKARAQALDAQRQSERTSSLAERNLASAAERDTAQSSAAAAQAQVKAAEGALAQAAASLNQAEVNLAYTTIRSPIDGIVISRSVDVGQTVAASFQAPIIFVLAGDLRQMQVDTNVAEADIGKIRTGMNVHFTVDAYPSERFQGTVRQLRNAPITVQNVVTYDAVIDVANPELKLKPGMTATVTFVTAERRGVLRIPNAALRFHWDPAPPPATIPAEKNVWVLRAGRPAPVLVRTGITNGSVTEIESGDVAEGMAVITEGGEGANDKKGGFRPPRMF